MQEMTPLAWAIRPLKRFAKFSGRAPRAEFWWFYLATIVVDRILTAVDSSLIGFEGILAGSFSLIILLPSIAVTVRRLHDTGRSGWWVVAMIALLALAVASYVGGGLDESFEGPWAWSTVVLGVAALTMAVTLFVFTVSPGSPQTNRYGADPYGPDDLEQVFA